MHFQHRFLLLNQGFNLRFKISLLPNKTSASVNKMWPALIQTHTETGYCVLSGPGEHCTSMHTGCNLSLTCQNLHPAFYGCEGCVRGSQSHLLCDLTDFIGFVMFDYVKKKVSEEVKVSVSAISQNQIRCSQCDFSLLKLLSSKALSDFGFNRVLVLPEFQSLIGFLLVNSKYLCPTERISTQ